MKSTVPIIYETSFKEESCSSEKPKFVTVSSQAKSITIKDTDNKTVCIYDGEELVKHIKKLMDLSDYEIKLSKDDKPTV